MALIEGVGLRIDLVDEGRGDPVLLLHAGGPGNRQWRKLVPELTSRYRVLAPNAWGYGETTAWETDGTQTLADQLRIVHTVCEDLPGPIRLVGHSYGGWVAMKAALELGERAAHLILIEPCPYALLRQAGRSEALAEAMAIRDTVKALGADGRWLEVAERYADYFGEDGTWGAISAERRDAFARQLLPNYFEWDSIFTDDTTAAQFGAMPAQVLVLTAPRTRRPIREMAEVLRDACPHWRHEMLPSGGHMVPVTHPELVNPLVVAWLK